MKIARELYSVEQQVWHKVCLTRESAREQQTCEIVNTSEAVCCH